MKELPKRFEYIAILAIFAAALCFCNALRVEAGATPTDQPESGDTSTEELPPPTQQDVSIEGLREQLKAEPTRPDLYVQLMVALMDKGDYTGALSLLEPLDKLGDPLWRSQGHMLAGKIVLEKLAPDAGDKKEELLKQAMEQFNMAIDLEYPYPTNLAAYWYLGDLQAELGFTKDAIETLSTYLVLKPHAYEARLRLAELYIKEGNNGRAKILLADMKSDPDDTRRAKASAMLRNLKLGELRNYFIIAGAIILAAVVVFVFFRIKKRIARKAAKEA